jgi:autophagy-related protein 9
MMASNLFSRILPSNHPTRSIYEDLRAHDEASESDIEEQAGMALDEENLGFHDEELAHADVFNGEDSRITTESTVFLGEQQRRAHTGKHKKHRRWFTQSPRLLEEDGDDDVPESLLVEDNEGPVRGNQSNPLSPKTTQARKPSAIPGPSSREARAHWEAAQAQQRLHGDDDPATPRWKNIPKPKTGMLSSSPREKAMWRWLNVVNLDQFIGDVYEYYIGSGIW